MSGPESDWHQIGSIYDPPQEEMKQSPGLKILNHNPMSGQGNTSIAKGAFSVRPSVPASFSVTWCARGIGDNTILTCLIMTGDSISVLHAVPFMLPPFSFSL